MSILPRPAHRPAPAAANGDQRTATDPTALAPEPTISAATAEVSPTNPAHPLNTIPNWLPADPARDLEHQLPLPAAGRYAPSPTGDLHIGNLRTAVLAWSFAHRDGIGFRLRVEDLDRVRAGSADGQIRDLAALGLTWQEPIIYQHERQAIYDAAIAELEARGLVYECYCSRKDIREATSAPHLAPGIYPGTCRDLPEAARAEARSRLAGQGRQPALRLRANVSEYPVWDLFAGRYVGPVDDVVLRRGDGVIAYNLAVVIDDALQGVTQVVRADDLLSSAPRQAYLAQLLGLPTVAYIHVPLVVNEQGDRLAKRDGAVSLGELRACGWDVGDVLAWIARTLPAGAATGGDAAGGDTAGAECQRANGDAEVLAARGRGLTQTASSREWDAQQLRALADLARKDAHAALVQLADAIDVTDFCLHPVRFTPPPRA